MRWWRRWRYHSKFCAAWSQDWGRDTHVCLLLKKHDGDHKCKCGAGWDWDKRKRTF